MHHMSKLVKEARLLGLQEVSRISWVWRVKSLVVYVSQFSFDVESEEYGRIWEDIRRFEVDSS